MATKVAPSIFAADFYDISGAVGRITAAGADAVHYDVMDNHFVPNISLGPKFIADVASKVKLTADAHLMIDLSRPLTPYLRLPVRYITLHVEASDGLILPQLREIKAHGIVPGISVKPGTGVEALYPYLDEVGLILVMSVEPGFSGQKFMPEAINRVSEIKKRTAGRNVEIQVDGGVGRDNYKPLIDAGADFLVIGSAFFTDPDPAGLVDEIHRYA